MPHRVAHARPMVALVAAALLAAALVAAPPRLGAAAAQDGGGAEAVAAGEEAASVAMPAPPGVGGEGSDLIRLMAGAFDPLTEGPVLPPELPAVTAASLDPSAAAYWLVQAAGGDFAGARAAIDAADGAVAAVVPDAAYLVRATPDQIAATTASAAVRAAVPYQPGSKVPSAAGDLPGLLELDGERDLRVFLFRSEPDLAAVRAQVAAVEGVTVLDQADSVVRVRATAAQVPALARIAGVQWIEEDPERVALNAQARWVNDTGVRDLYSATIPERLTGEGQVAAVADTGLNYTTDVRGEAQRFFRDCAVPTSECEEAEYLQSEPGTDTTAALTTVPVGDDHRKMVAYFDIGGTGPRPTDTSAHGTHVAGSVTGDSGVLGVADGEDGMAPAARHVHQNIGTPSGGLTGLPDDYDLWRQAYRPSDPLSVPDGYDPDDYANYDPDEDARTHNNSYGLVVSSVSLGSAEAADRFVFEHEDMFIVSSAGNSGPGPFEIGAPSIGRNVITSAASANGRQPMVSIDSLASFSSHGPTASEPFGVDFATPGQVVVSAKGGTSEEVQYLQGTSMSGPLLTGLATLVRQYFADGYGPTVVDAPEASASGFAVGDRDPDARGHNPSAALVRATLADGAQRMRGFYTGDDGTQRALDGQYPSAGQGFGLVNLSESLYFDDEQGTSDEAHWYHDVWRADDDAFDLSLPGLAAERTYELEVAEGQPLSVSMAFSDAPTGLPAGAPLAVNDLDLVVTSPSGDVYTGNNFNTRTNPLAEDHQTIAAPFPLNPDPGSLVERVRVTEPEAGAWTVTVVGQRVVEGPQGFALAASGALAPTEEGAAGPELGGPLQVDVSGFPTIADVEVTPVAGDTAKLTWTTSEPTFGEVAVLSEEDAPVYPDVYNLGFDSYRGIETGPVETSEQYADRPVLQTTHEVLLTGLSPGEHDLEIRAVDLAERTATASAALETPEGVVAAEAFDIAQLTEAPTDPVSSFDPILGIGDGVFGLGTQLYGGKSANSGILGAFMFRLPESLDPARIRGAAVELTSGHDLTNHYADDVRVHVDLLEPGVETNWRTSNYTEIKSAESDARANPETGSRRGGGNAYPFSFGCAELEALRSTLATVTDDASAPDQPPSRNAAFRFDGTSSEATSLFGTEFGFNRRSRGADLRPRLVLFLDDGDGAATDPLPCDADAPAPAVSDVRVQYGVVGPNDLAADPAVDETSTVTVSWATDVPSDSTVLFRPVGGRSFTQVGTDVETTAHSVQVSGLEPGVDYEFAVRAAACNGRTTTDEGPEGGGWLLLPPQEGGSEAPPPVPRSTFFFHGNPNDQTAGTGTFDEMAPTAVTPDFQLASQFANEDVPFNTLVANWTGPVPGPVDGTLVFDWFFTSASPTGAAFDPEISVTVFGDPVRGGGAQPERIIGRALADIAIGPTPTRNTTVIRVETTTPLSTLQVQVGANFIDTGNDVRVAYDATSAPSSFSFPLEPEPEQAAVGAAAPGPVVPAPAGARNFDAASAPTRTVPEALDVASGTARCATLDTSGGVVAPPPAPPQPSPPPGEEGTGPDRPDGGSGTDGPGTDGPDTGGPGPGAGGDGDGDGDGGEPALGPVVERVFGTGRIETGVELSREAFSDAPAAVLARADAFPDALAAASLAAEIGGPVLLTGSDRLAPVVADELRRLGVERVYLAGGPAALAPQVQADAAALGVDVVRLAGVDRFVTADAIGREVVRLGGPVERVVLARADDFPDALAASNVATYGRAPILLAATTELPQQTQRALDALLPDGAGEVLVAGGSAVVAPEVESAVAARGHDVRRLSGGTRFDTAVALAREAVALGADLQPTVVANGFAFPDALAAGPAAHAQGGALLIVDPVDATRSQVVLDLLTSRDEVQTVLVAGGDQAIAPLVESQLRAAIGVG